MIQNAEYENNLNVCLELPEWLYYEREDELLIHAAIRHNNVVRIKETFSRFHNLYDSIASARFNLYSAFNEKVAEVPKSIWQTYSAFANTIGGLILLGVNEDMQEKEIFPESKLTPSYKHRTNWITFYK